MARHPELSGLLFIISAPSGAGKTSLVSALIEAENDVQVSVSHTTRPRREAEVDGVNYHFVDLKTFDKMVEDKIFLEHAEVFGHFYGTSREWVEGRMQQGENVILEIDWQGANQVREVFPESVNIFILPPSYQALENRLIGRGDESEEVIRHRMQGAIDEISHYRDYQYIIINDDFQAALQDLRGIIRACNHNVLHQPDFYRDFADNLIKQGQ